MNEKRIQRSDGDGYMMVADDPLITNREVLKQIHKLELQLADVVIALKQLETEQALQSEALASLEETY